MNFSRLKNNSIIFRCFICFILLFSLVGCIDESLDGCSTEKHLLRFTVRDVLTNEDITETEPLENIRLYLFDSKKRFLESIEISASQISGRALIDITDKNVKNGYAVVWANMNDSITRKEPKQGQLISETFLFKKINTEYPDYYLSSGNLFYGLAPLVLDNRTEAVSEIEVKRKNGQLNIIVGGIIKTEDPNDYYFKISTFSSGYNFEGELIEERINIREDRVFQGENRFISPSPFRIMHSSPYAKVGEENSITVHLYKRGNYKRGNGLYTEDNELVSANKDVEGNFINIKSGQTTNVLMQIDESGRYTVYVVMTPWNEIYQWNEW